MKKSYKTGYITVYLSLTVGILLSFLFTLIEGARMKTIQFQIECVTDIGLNSIFAEYNREMLEQYDLLFIDSSYGLSNPTPDRTKSHLIQYMNLNFNPPGKNAIEQYKDLTALNADNARLDKISFASDDCGKVMEYQIQQLIKDTKGLSFLTNSGKSYEEYKQRESEYETYRANRSQNKEVINGIIDEINANREEDKDPVGIDNPADAVEELSTGSVLNYAIKDVNSISRNTCNLSEYISHRASNKGCGLDSSQQVSDSVLSKNLYTKYILDKCGYFNNKKENAKINYQIEYLLKGKDSDVSNLELVAEQIFKIRYAINMAYLFSDSGKQMEAEELALAVTSAIMQPQLCEAVKISILFAWGYAESAKDLRILFDGHKLPDIKNDSTWNTPLSQMVTFKSHLGEYHTSADGKSYKDYIHLFLMLNDKNTTNIRLMDIMEMDIRKTMGNRHFQMDYCIYQLRAEINVSSKYGYGYQINRFYSYE